MATVEHCLFCFETLAAHLAGREALTLEDVEKLYAEYCEADETPTGQTESSTGGSTIKKRIPALSRLANPSSSGTSSPSSGSSMSLATDTPGTSTSSLENEHAVPITESPLFITWNTVSARSGNTSLRGCIGTFEAQDLEDGLSSYAITSAIHDMRFDPVSKRELPSLEVAVTLLTDFEDCDDAMDWELGTHGLRISFTDRGRRYGATYLPDVASEQGWTKEETLMSLMRKAGWVGKKDKWQDVDLTVVRYQGKKEHLQYPEFKQWREWIESQGKA